MYHKTTYFYLLIFAFSLLLNCSCEKEETEPRTWEMEMEELGNLLKSHENKGDDIDTTNMSVFYIVRKNGEGPYPKTGDSCVVSYQCFLSNGQKIEDSFDIYPDKGKWHFTFKPPHDVIGFINGIGYMNKGCELEMFITSDLAYGKKGASKIPPYTTLIYRAIMHDLQPKN